MRERADRLESLMTRFREDSEISGLTDQWQKVSPDTAAVLGAAKFYEHQTSGWFCALVGAQMRVWDRRVAVYADGGEAAAVAGVTPGTTSTSPRNSTSPGPWV